MSLVLRSGLVGLLVLAACGSAGEVAEPSFYVEVSESRATTGSRVQTGDTVAFRPGVSDYWITLGNVGDANLLLSGITIVSRNAEMAVLPDPIGISFPREIVAGTSRPTDPTALQFRVSYNPGATPDNTPTTLEFSTDDFDLPNGLFILNISPREEKAELRVTPPNYIFTEATTAQPDTADFVLSNVGSAPLALANIGFDPQGQAFRVVGMQPNKDTVIDPDVEGGPNGPRTITVQYQPQNPPEESNMFILWGPVMESGVRCTSEDVCRNSDTLCPDKATCPYTCGNGKCVCLSDADCQAALCAEGEACNVVCLTGVCRQPVRTDVKLTGQTQPGQLRVEHADMEARCVDFSQVIVENESCTKIVKMWNDGEGTVRSNRPLVNVTAGTDNPYQVRWYRLGATQEAACGEVSGEEITDPQFTITAANQPVNVAVTYTAPGSKGVNGDLVFDYWAPFKGQEIVRLCGGVKKGELGVAPPLQQPLIFFAPSGGKASKTVVIMNKGNEVLSLKGFEIKPANVGEPQKFTIKTQVSAAQMELAPLQLLPLEIEFDGDYDGGVLNAFLYIRYVEPLIDLEQEATVQLRGQNNFDGIDLPVANAGSPGDYTGARVGDALVLNGGSSIGGSFPIPGTSGYTWFVYSKPLTSTVFLNTGAGPAQVSFIPDVAGDYSFRLVVLSGDPATGYAYASDEASISFRVNP
jgi:hypothetical protein